ncbi:MAG: SH3 domain-containing protein [Leptolyngbyaceae cyanobacterium CSU_1_4]|nr:SH3 domain-containing protein [Leptolyngbyaceae cyanobacterium CSU_1_4]
MATRNSNTRPRLAAKLLLPAALGIMLLTACSSVTKPSAKTSAKTTGATEQEKAAGALTFPQATCGEEASTPSENWYPVFIDGAELSAIRSQYCGNAISEIRSKTGAPTVQVASFTSYEKAKKFAAAVGGEVDVVGSALGAKPGSSQGNSANSEGLTTGKTATLASAETGSPINIRQSASTDASVQEVAYSGDAIKVASKTQGTDGYTWYKVELDSGASGWVRSDLISATSASSNVSARPSGEAGRETGRETGREATSTATSTPSDAASTTIASAPTSSSGSSTTTASSPATDSTGSTAETRATTPSGGRTATIASSDPDSPINVRSGAGTDAEVQDVAYGGDRIEITDSQQGDDGQTWYKVEFESGASGWVRSDFIDN